jgi:hypothetical protein
MSSYRLVRCQRHTQMALGPCVSHRWWFLSKVEKRRTGTEQDCWATSLWVVAMRFESWSVEVDKMWTVRREVRSDAARSTYTAETSEHMHRTVVRSVLNGRSSVRGLVRYRSMTMILLNIILATETFAPQTAGNYFTRVTRSVRVWAHFCNSGVHG